ncbi:glycoside hydrolase family 28 protein [Sphaerobolus stellatus SS14]|uniref:galacturonan 1,4-alpha-galacturonidase n=1 Tax=Sphaerobolus stellatus (strain SS14) TaxID=990650 RepID=A0A0C9V7L0_SPHS4|nr:glycoside hydrolase family 28 protein [Sphaerobolus stellatus SS14]
MVSSIVWNTDGIDTYRSDSISLIDWDVSTGDDCLAIKGNSTNIFASNILCRGGEGVAIGSLGQYQQFNDIVENVHIENVRTQRPPAVVQPNMISGVYFKTWTSSVHGAPPTGGGGGGGRVNNVTVINLFHDDVTTPVRIFQNNGGQPGDIPSKLQISNLNFVNLVGSANTSQLVDLECSPAVPCRNIRFQNFNIQAPKGEKPILTCSNISVTGLPGSCNAPSN